MIINKNKFAVANKLFLLTLVITHICSLPLKAQSVINPNEAVIPIVYKNNPDRAYRFADSIMQQMSDREMLAQLIMPMIYPSSQPKTLASIEQLYVKHGFGGILFQKGTPADQVHMANMLRAKCKIPVLVAADAEWGLSMRLSGTPKYPRNIVIGATNDKDLAKQFGAAVAKELKRVGVHVNFAPVVDVNNNARNPVIGTRSFGSDPNRVSEMSDAVATGLEQNGVLSCAKHFPGHGNTTVDSHKGLPVIQGSREELEKIELLPFRRYINKGLGGIMTAHLSVPGLNTGSKPASLSYSVVTELLQDELRFRGLIFTDGLNMAGAQVGQGESLAVQAFLAGNDILLAPESPVNSLAQLVDALNRGVIKRDEMLSRCRKVLAMKYALGVFNSAPIPLNNLSADLNPAEHINLIHQISKASITLLQNTTRSLPLRNGSDIAIVKYGRYGISALSSALSKDVKVQNYNDGQLGNANTRQLLSKKSAVLVTVTSKMSANNNLLALCKQSNVILVFACDPYTMLSFKSVIPHAKSVVVAYDHSDYALNAVAEALLGKSPMVGTLPVDLPGLFKVGSSVQPAPNAVNYNYLPLPKTDPTKVGLKNTLTAGIDRIAQEGVDKGAYPGCQVVVAKDGHIVYSKAFGWKDASHREPNDREALYDLASITKAAAMVPLLMMEVDKKAINISDPIDKYLPYLKGSDKGRIRISELLYHISGLPATIHFYNNLIDPKTYAEPLISFKGGAGYPIRIDSRGYARSGWSYDKNFVATSPDQQYSLRFGPKYYLNQSVRDMMREEIKNAPLLSKKSRYSDIGFILLQDIIETLEGDSLDQLFDREIAQPLGLKHTLFKPYTRFDKKDIVEGQNDRFLRKSTLRGDVDDETSAMLGGVAGNAGLYSNAEELAVILQMLLNNGSYADQSLINEATVKQFTTARHSATHYAWGFDRPRGRKDSNYVSPQASKNVYGHTGYTGTCFWIDPDNKLVYIFLSNRGAPNRWNNKLMTLKTRRKIQDVIYSSLE